MDTQRLILIGALAFIGMLLYQQWQRDYGPPPVPVEEVAQAQPGEKSRADVPDAPALPAAKPAAGKADTPAAPKALESAGRVHVTTDALDLEIDLAGGDVRRADLLLYPVDPSTPDKPVRLLNERQGTKFFVVQSGLLANQGTAPDHHTVYTASQDRYVLADGQDSLTVDLNWTSPEGVQVTRTMTFKRGSHVIDVNYHVNNASADTWSGRPYYQIRRANSGEGLGDSFIYTYTGGVIYSEAEAYEKYDFDDMAEADLSREITGGWAAMIQHYFLSAWVPDPIVPAHYYTKSLGGGQYSLGMVNSHWQDVAAGSTHDFRTRLVVGPKLQKELEAVTESLKLTVDYGWLTVVAQPLFWVLEKIHSVVGNWGWAIILVTILIKLVFYKLSETSYKSMANMRRITPRMQALKERFGDDRQKLNQAMMDLYKKEKINPLGGCLPILVQIPVFIALYWVLLESVELRQAPFILWLQDLSAPDHFYVLPVLMGVTMLIQQKLNPAPLDPIQQKVMMILPIVFTVMFAFFPSGLVLYWVVNNALSIVQQWVITRRIAPATT